MHENIKETVGFMSVSQVKFKAIVEFGSLEISQEGRSPENNHEVVLKNKFTNPIVVMGPLSMNDSK